MLNSQMPLVVGVTFFFSAISAGAVDRSVIDLDLDGQIDFRTPEYGACLGLAQCTVGGITLFAERRNDGGTDWVAGELYWDPIDGFGVRDGAQNDEIDFDERLRISFAQPVDVDRVWFSDLFHTEDGRYGSSNTDRIAGAVADTEVAGIRLFLDELALGTQIVSAQDALPWASFNQEVSQRFEEDGDMRRRVVINEDVVTLVVPGERNGRQIGLNLRLGEIDKDKKSIFEGVETVEIDLTEILAEFHNSPLFVRGNTNFEVIESIVESPGAVQKLREIAERKRSSIDMSNGEVARSLDVPFKVDTIEFFAPFDASNDFSVAGVVIRREVD